MPKVLPAVFSYEDMKSKWNQDNPNNPYTRRADLESGIYALDSWLIRVDDEGKTIATIGWKEHPSHTVVGGLLATHRANPQRPEFEGKHLARNERALQSAREPQLNQSKPLVAGFGAREGSSEEWIQRGRDRGWKFAMDDNFNEVKGLLPEEVINAWNARYPTGNWAIRTITDASSLAKWVFIDDPMPAWFNVIKYLPDNTWDDFELGEPVPDLGTRDRFKDKNIKSKGKAEYKAFITQQYLRQVSDRIPNAGTSLMKGWLEKLTELDLDKGKYWYFGTNVKEDRTYVMIDVIEKGQTYTRTASKKFNLEGMDKGIVFVGVSKEMVGKIKRGQGIPKGRKFIDLHGRYGVRGLRGQRRLPKQPTNPFPKPQDIEKSWKDILKVLPYYEEYGDDNRPKTSIGEKGARTRQFPDDTAIMFSPHYMDSFGEGKRLDGKQRRNVRMELITDEIEQGLLSLSQGTYWFYLNSSPRDHSYVIVDIIEDPNKEVPQLVNAFNDKLKLRTLISRQEKGQNIPYKKLVYISSLGGRDFSYPNNAKGPDKEPILNFYYEGIKPEHFAKPEQRPVSTKKVQEQKKTEQVKDDDKYTDEERKKILEDTLSPNLRNIAHMLPRQQLINYIKPALEEKVKNNDMTEEEMEEILRRL